jgi:hypothetical protein
MAGFFILDPRFEMPSLLEPGRKPVGPVVINWDHWASKGLVASYEFQANDQSVIDLVSGLVVQLPSNHFITPQGLYMKAHSGVSLDVQPQNLLILDEWVIVSAGAGFDENFKPNTFYSEIGANNGDAIELARVSGGQVLELKVTVNFTDAVAQGTVDIRGTGEHSFLAQKRNGNIEVYTDGNDLQSTAQTATDTSNNTATIGSSLKNLANGGVDEGTLNYLRIYKNRSFTAEQARSIQLNPYQHLIPA